jgi:N-acetylmuramoyl-L-alanine amidase
MTPKAHTQTLRSRAIQSAAPAALSILSLLGCGFPAYAQKRSPVHEQFEQAVRLRERLESTNEKDRTLADYKTTVGAFRRVFMATSRVPEAPDSLFVASQLYREMGKQFEPEYFDTAIVTYRFLLRSFPNSHYRPDALFNIGQIQQQDLDRLDDAKATFQEYLKQFPHSERSNDARVALDQIAEARANPAHAQVPAPTGSSAAPAAPTGTAPGAAAGSPTANTPAPPANGAPQSGDDPAGTTSGGSLPAKGSRPPRVTNIRSWNADDYTRIVVDLDNSVKFQSSRILSPDRIYFDLYGAKLAPGLAGRTFDVNNGFLKSIRAGQNKAGVVRLVLDVDSVKEYSAFLLLHPYRLVIDVHGEPAPAEQALNRTKQPAAKSVSTAPAKAASEAPATSTTSTDMSEPKLAAATPAAELPDNRAPETPMKQPKELPIRRTVARNNITPGTAPESKLTHDGQRSLTRALGLKISRIVIDAGHGGHDTGTIGPHGLLEKDLCLDVALRLGSMIEDRLPGAEVIYTRKDDSFVSLEQRTAIANEARADLFISIHANSSHDPKARGIETYYLNFSTSQDAMEVAARENALAQTPIHDLQDMIQKIARNEKIEESKELAGDIQTSLARKMQQSNRGDVSRGVKRAPFVVLIGADMPSVLTEISFISNPNDEKLLRKNEQRDTVAEGLFRGVSSYLDSLNSLNFKQQKIVSMRPASLASDGNSK